MNAQKVKRDRNGQLRIHIVQVMTGLGRPVTASVIADRCDSRCPELMTDGVSLFVVATNLGFLRTEGVTMRRNFRTGRNITVRGVEVGEDGIVHSKIIQETVALWFLQKEWSREKLNEFQEQFIIEMNAKRKAAADARKIHQST